MLVQVSLSLTLIRFQCCFSCMAYEKEREKCKELVAKAKQDEENDESGDFI